MTDRELDQIRREVAEHKAATEFPVAARDLDDTYQAATQHPEYSESRH
jgi:hypothetical protein